MEHEKQIERMRKDAAIQRADRDERIIADGYRVTPEGTEVRHQPRELSEQKQSTAALFWQLPGTPQTTASQALSQQSKQQQEEQSRDGFSFSL